MLKPLASVLLIVGTLLLVPGSLQLVNKVIDNRVSERIIVQQYKDQGVPTPVEALNSREQFKVYPVKEIIELESKNTVSFRGPVTEDSVAKAMKEIQEISRKVGKKDVIYLVLDTPGGSVLDGLDFIDFVKALPQRVETITLFAASMGFQIAQNLDDRLITPQGTLMSHRARGGVSGQFDGELEERYNMIKRKIDYMDHVASQRMGLTMSQYKKLILNEYWVHGFDATEDKAADRQVLVRCGKTMEGTETLLFASFFGSVKVVVSKCPMIRAPISVSFDQLSGEQTDAAEVKLAVDQAFNNKRAFVEKYILTDKFYKIFK